VDSDASILRIGFVKSCCFYWLNPAFLILFKGFEVQRKSGFARKIPHSGQHTGVFLIKKKEVSMRYNA